MNHFAVIDFETTGLSPRFHRIIEAGAAIVRDGEIVSTFSELMNPGVRVPAKITAINGITDEMLVGKPRPEDVMPNLRAFLGDLTCVAHNAHFDQGFFNVEMERAGQGHSRDFVCSVRLARQVFPKAPNHQLGTLVQMLGIEVPAGHRAHRALDDVMMTVRVWRRLHQPRQVKTINHT